MNSIKKIATLSALCVGLSCCIPSVYGAEIKENKNIINYGFAGRQVYDSATTPAYLSLSQVTRDSKVYIVMSLGQPGMYLTVNGSSANIVQDDLYHCSYQVTQSGRYDVTASGNGYAPRTESIYITMGDKNTSLELSKQFKNGGCYLIIKGRDDDGIRSVSVNDITIDFNNEYSGETSYRVYSTGTYKVILTDKSGNRTQKSLYIDVNSEQPALELSKITRSGRWYLVIKAYADNKIKQVTVNDNKISFPSDGGTQEYEITKSDTYKVVVTDSEDYKRTNSIYIDMGERTSEKPVVKVSQNYKVNGMKGWYLLIKASDDRGIASVTVNGSSVPFDTSAGMAEYYVPTDGTYNIAVTDTDGNTYTTSTYAAGNASINSNVISNSTNSGSAKIIFKLNSKTWTKDGVVQEQMNIAPKSANARVYLPIRYLAYALDINSGSISWNKNTKTVTIQDGSDVIKVTVGSKVMYVNDQTVKMNAAPIMRSGYVMLPISQIKSAFKNRNVQLSWDNINKELIINR